MSRSVLLASVLAATLISGACSTPGIAVAQSVSEVPTPASVIGHDVGADYKLARWETIVDYHRRLGDSSDRVRFSQIGTATEGNPYVLVEISSPETIRQLDRYRELQHKLADPRRIKSDRDRRNLLATAKTTIVVTCSLHSNELAASQMSMELAYDLATSNDPRVLEILDNCIILLVPSANPDGNNKIVDWYESNLNTPYEGSYMPWLYQKYAGHDNNRDWFMLNLKETRILSNVLYHEWFPTILYDIHQMGNRGPRFFVPPFFDPVNPNVDPLIHQSLLIIGGHMATELQEQKKTGVVYKAIFDNWWQGGNRTTPYRHNIVGILTEAASAKLASPIFQEASTLRGGGRGFPEYAPMVNFPEPWPGGWWRMRDIVDYEKTACMALFTLAARYRDRFVHNHLTLSEKSLSAGSEGPPFAWLIPPDQRDPGAAAHMLEVLRLSGIEVHQAEKPFSADHKRYPAGTYVLLARQPYRPHLKDMMERQEYPERRLYPGGPAEPPYDSAGWTLPLQMGVSSVEVTSRFTAKLRPAELIEAKRMVPPAASAGYITKRFANSDYTAVNALLADGFHVSVLNEPFEGYPVGSIVVSNTNRPSELTSRIQALTQSIPARFQPLQAAPPESALRKMTAPRTALYQPWTASMDEGWTRYVLEQFDFPYTTVHNAEIRAGGLRDRFDCIIIPDLRLSSLLDGRSIKNMPSPYAGGIGPDGAMNLERFVTGGGTLVLMDSATQLATQKYHVPVRDVLEGVGADEFFCPGSLLRLRIKNTHPLGYGFADEAAAYFARSQAFEIGRPTLKPPDGAPPKTAEPRSYRRQMTDDEINAKLADQVVTSVASYADNFVLLSGWILGEDRLRNRTAVCEIDYGDGHIVLLGFRVQHRGQPHGTFKFLFNAIYRSTLESEAASSK